MAVEGAQARGLALQRRRRRAAGGHRARRRAVSRKRARSACWAARTSSPSPADRRRTAAGRSGRHPGCCATARARTRGRRGSRACGARTAVRAGRRRRDCHGACRAFAARRCGATPAAVQRRALRRRRSRSRSSSRPMSVLESLKPSIAPARSASGQRTISMRSSSPESCPPSSLSPSARKRWHLVGEADRGAVGLQERPARGLADLLGELALGGLQRRLAVLVQPAGGQLEAVGIVDRLARLAHEPEMLVVERDDRGRAGVRDDLARRPPAVGVAVGVVGDRDDPPGEDGPRRRCARRRGHAASWLRHRVHREREGQTSSIPSSAATLTRSVGSWLRSVPLARLTD